MWCKGFAVLSSCVIKQNILGFFFQNTEFLGHSKQAYLSIDEITNHLKYLHLDFT